MPINHNDRSWAIRSPDPHGEAALLLVESLIHGLCEIGKLSVRDAIMIAERAVDVQFDRAEDTDDPSNPGWKSRALLASIASSLKIDSDAPSPPVGT